MPSLGAGAENTLAGTAEMPAVMSVTVKEAMSAATMKIFLIIVQYPLSVSGATSYFFYCSTLTVYERTSFEVTTLPLKNVRQNHPYGLDDFAGQYYLMLALLISYVEFQDIQTVGIN
ncbi:MAG: hypothetical protein ACI3Y5_03550 [Prevotella sp.]